MTYVCIMKPIIHMLRLRNLSLLFSVAFLLVLTQSLVMKQDGAEPGHTGSPGDSFKNCTVCHGGISYNVDNWITSNVPSSGYVPGVTYTIWAVNREIGSTRFGFQISPQDSAGNLLGKMTLTDPIRTKLVGNDKYITYTSNGVKGYDSAVWSFEWTAPKLEEDVVFYGGFNSNIDGHKGGDKTYLSTLRIKRNLALNVKYDLFKKGVKVYPNPTTNILNLDFELLESGKISIYLMDMNGKTVLTLADESVNAGHFTRTYSTNEVANGVYTLVLELNGQTFSKKIKVLH